MDEQKIINDIEAINKKLDIILAEIELQQRHRREMDDLKDDLMRIGKDVYDTAVTELEEVHDHIQTGDMLYLGKKLLRNVNNITKSFEQFENVKDFVYDFKPVSREMFFDFMNRLDEMDRKGYFAFMKEMGVMMDKVVSTFSREDAKQLGDNIVTILNTIKNLTQPDMLNAVNNAVSIYKNLDTKIDKKVTVFYLLKELNKPEVKKGLALALNFLKNLNSNFNANNNSKKTSTPLIKI
jgi:uncharacterized protein YjgD (DUF1641 family)